MAETAVEEYEVFESDEELHVINVIVQAANRHICKQGLHEYPDDAAGKLRRIANYVHSKLNSMADEFDQEVK
jgi:hypothetical protein